MEEYLDESALARPPGRKYAQSEASKKISEAPGAPREEPEDVDSTGGEVLKHHKNKTDVLQALGALRGYCAMSMAEKDAEDGKKALAYHGAVPMVVCGLGEKNIRVATFDATTGNNVLQHATPEGADTAGIPIA
jgi:hypothetical protein